MSDDKANMTWEHSKFAICSLKHRENGALHWSKFLNLYKFKRLNLYSKQPVNSILCSLQIVYIPTYYFANLDIVFGWHCCQMIHFDNTGTGI